MASQNQQRSSSSSSKLDGRSEPFYPILKEQWRSLAEKLKLQEDLRSQSQPQQPPPCAPSTMSSYRSLMSSSRLSSATSLLPHHQPQQESAQPTQSPGPECGWRADEEVREDLYRYGAGATSAPVLQRYPRWRLFSLGSKKRGRSLGPRSAGGRDFRASSPASKILSGEGEEEEEDDDGGDVDQQVVDQAGFVATAGGDSELQELWNGTGRSTQVVKSGERGIRAGGESVWAGTLDDGVGTCKVPKQMKSWQNPESDPPQKSPKEPVDHQTALIPGRFHIPLRPHDTFKMISGLASDPVFAPVYDEFFPRSD